MFKPTPQLQRKISRLKLTTKQASSGYYKGNRVGSMGWHTKHGGYKIDWAKVRTYCVPDLTGFRLTPFVTKQVSPPKGDYSEYEKGPLDGKFYLDKWKASGAELMPEQEDWTVDKKASA